MSRLEILAEVTFVFFTGAVILNLTLGRPINWESMLDVTAGAAVALLFHYWQSEDRS